MYIVDREKGNQLDVFVKEWDRKPLSSEFNFVWRYEETVYGLFLQDGDSPLGMVGISYYHDELRIEINLLETARSHRGKHKKYDRVAGCLIAFVAEKALEMGEFTMVSLVAKTQLITHYCEAYGFVQVFGQLLVLEGEYLTTMIENYGDALS